jgi:hypothetical protein
MSKTAVKVIGQLAKHDIGSVTRAIGNYSLKKPMEGVAPLVV